MTSTSCCSRAKTMEAPARTGDRLMKIALLDDYQGVALACADWPGIVPQAEVTVFRDTIADADALVARLRDFEVIGIMRERTPFPRALLERLPKLKLLVTTGHRNDRSEEHTSELQSLMRISYAVFCLKKKKNNKSLMTTTNTEPLH